MNKRRATDPIAPARLPQDVDATQALLRTGDYLAGRDLATVVFLALRMGRPLLLEGEAGVGKTEVAKVLAGTLGRELIRLQCHEGLDLAGAAYEWNYPRQMVAIRLAEASGAGSAVAASLYGREFLVERPLLSALRERPEGPPVLLIDEIDRADEPFEAFLLELLSDFQLSIPELGTVRAPVPPIVVITSNRTREIHDALRRRCLYHWLEYPDFETELRIIALKAPGIRDEIRRELVAFVQRLRQEELFKRPGVAEAIDWAHALEALDVTRLAPRTVTDTLGLLLKYQDDIVKFGEDEAAKLLEAIRAEC
ncbi:MAG TPA: MoxR family ATPase [Steroidobacteraceae bacterium]|nr:MoxR family ATPase [Steroidobacteraceae bacterium]HQW08214.1 MoxR family ATPase [Steroidobacteraceae bacterium]HQX77550.1 MoxR family ATPase [Steroidobacteraceae bacterium]HQZ80043.1 MoxR family ATPase [Steroidobacteraceae bacterium]